MSIAEGEPLLESRAFGRLPGGYGKKPAESTTLQQPVLYLSMIWVRLFLRRFRKKAEVGEEAVGGGDGNLEVSVVDVKVEETVLGGGEVD